MKLHLRAGNRLKAVLAAGGLPLLLTGACGTAPAPDSTSSFDAALRGGDAGARQAWIVRAAAEPDNADERILVEGLYSDDGGERMLSITALNNKYGERLGYDYAAPRAARTAAAERWREKLFPQRNFPQS